MYRASDLNFAGELQRAFEVPREGVLKTDSKHLDVSDNSEAFLMPDYSGATRADGNNVDIDIQMARLNQNTGDYSIATNLMRKKLTLLNSAIRNTN
jgi:flagellar basal-body rod protein FlgB